MSVIGQSGGIEKAVYKPLCNISSFSERMYWLNTDIHKIPSYD